MQNEKRIIGCFWASVPCMVKYYLGFGARRYMNSVTHPLRGLRVPLVFLPYDHAYLQNLGSPFYDVIAKVALHRPEQAPEDSVLFPNLQDETRFLLPEKDLQTIFLSRDIKEKPIFTRNMDQARLRDFLHDFGCVIDFPEKKCLFPKIYTDSHSSRCFYILLDGTLSVQKDGTLLKILKKGQVYNEAFFYHSLGRVDVFGGNESGKFLMIKGASNPQPQ